MANERCSTESAKSTFCEICDGLGRPKRNARVNNVAEIVELAGDEGLCKGVHAGYIGLDDSILVGR